VSLIEQILRFAFESKGMQAYSLPGANLCLHTSVFGYAGTVQKHGKLLFIFSSQGNKVLNKLFIDE
jgi:hypothetical protein